MKVADERTGDSNDSRVAGQIAGGSLTCVEVFLKEDIDRVDREIATFVGVDGGRHREDTTKESRRHWRPPRIRDFFTEVVKRSDGEGWGGSLELLKRFVKEVQVEAVDVATYPFYLVALRAHLNPKAMNDSSDLAKDLQLIHNTLRVSLESLRGMTAQARGGSPRIPVCLFLGVRLSSADLARIQRAVETLERAPVSSWQEAVARGEELRQMEPFALTQAGWDLHSHIRAFGNLSMIFGHLYQLGIYGLSTPYIILLSSDESVLQPQLIDTAIVPTVPRDPREITWLGPGAMTLPLALLVWKDWLWVELNRIEGEVALSKRSIDQTDPSGDVSALLERLTAINLSVSSLRIDVELIARRFGPTLDGWRERSYPGPPEVPVFPSESTLAIMSGIDFREGYLGALSREVRDDLSRIARALDSLGSRTEALSRQAQEVVLRKSMQATESATRATKRLSWILVVLTAVLVVLTVVIVFR